MFSKMPSRKIFPFATQLSATPPPRQRFFKPVHIFRLAVGREADELVFAGVHAEAGEVSERRIQEAERVRKMQFAEHLDFAAATRAVARGRPFAHAGHREKRRVRIRRWKKR